MVYTMNSKSRINQEKYAVECRESSKRQRYVEEAPQLGVNVRVCEGGDMRDDGGSEEHALSVCVLQVEKW